MLGLTDRVCVVFGGAAGIGAATAHRLAAEGARVVVGDIDVAGARAVVAGIDEAGGSARAVQFDITDESSVASVLTEATHRFGPVSGAHVNVADLSSGVVGRDGDARDLPMEVFDRTIEVNLRGHLIATRAVVPALLEAGGGAIVYSSSDAAVTGDPSLVSYAVSKSGLNALMRHVASRWGKENIRANAVSPGMVLRGHERERSAGFADVRDGVLAATRSPRLGRPEDVAALVAFLLSADGEWINGQVIRVDGGLTMG